MMSVLVALALAVAEPAPPVQPADTSAKSGWLSGPFSFSFENDSLPLAGGDESYTQGLELHVSLSEELPKPLRVLRDATRSPLRKLRGGRDFVEGSSLFIGQTLFTPQNIVTYEPRRDDRPFVGFLYAGVSSVLQSDWAKDEGRVLHPRRLTGQLLVGVTGYDAALGRTAQGAFHVLRESRIPKGWDTQAGNRPELDALVMGESIVSPSSVSRHLDLTILGQAALGTTQTFLTAGAVARLGWGLSGFPPTGIPRSAGARAPDHLEIAAFAGAEAKRFFWNRLADQGGEGRPDFEPAVYEWRFGAMVRLKNGLSLSYTVRRRSQEIAPLPEGLVARHWIGAVQIAKSESLSEPSHCFDFMKGVRANFGLGRGRSSAEPGLPAAPHISLAGHWGLEKSLFADRFAVALEMAGVAREHGRGEGTGHEDTFLLARVATLGVDVLPGLAGRQRLQLRVGGGRALVKTQLTPAEGGISEPELLPDVSEAGWSGLVGLRYALRLGNPLSLATDGTYSRLFLDGTHAGVRRAGYWTWTLGVQIHPWGRDRGQVTEATTGHSMRPKAVAVKEGMWSTRWRTGGPND